MEVPLNKILHYKSPMFASSHFKKHEFFARSPMTSVKVFTGGSKTSPALGDESNLGEANLDGLI